MGARAGTALRMIQWFTRAVEFCCAVVILALFSYFLATLASNNLAVGQWIRAVEGIAGAAVLYTLVALLLLFCVAGHPFLSSIFIFLDICFVGAFIYIASANRHGAGSCDGQVTTALGTGNANTSIVDNGHGGVVTLDPNLHQACKMQSACLAVAILGLLFFILSAILEGLLIRHRRKERRFGPSPINGYTSGYGKTPSSPSHPPKQGFFSRFSKRNRRRQGTDNSDVLPAHPHPDDLRDSNYTHNRASTYNTNTTSGITGTTMTTTDPEDVLPPPNTGTATQQPMSGVNTGNGFTGGSSTAAGTGSNNNTAPSPTAGFPPGNYRYDDGVYDRM
ncbi:hypothetical protein V8F06_007171 [Rhypophila decipiens]